MNIECVGHSCFYLTTEKGIRILTDPYDNSIGLLPVRKEADIVLISHDHFDHNFTQGITGDYELINKPGDYEVKGVKITGLPTYHDDQKGALRGPNIVFIIEVDGMRIMHSGDLGVMPGADFFKKAGHIDILMVPIGGTYTLDAKGAFAFVEKFNPNITIPMHYKVPSLEMDIAGLHEFLKLASKVYDTSRLGSCQFDISADRLKKRNRITVMECCNAG